MSHPRSGRRSIRIPGYDYSQPGYYFITICVDDARCMFGDVQNGWMVTNAAGAAVHDAWQGIPRRFPSIQLDSFVIMPNHVHGIVAIEEPMAPSSDKEHNAGLPAAIGAFKSLSTAAANKVAGRAGPFWERNYWEHVIRNERALREIREYIITNPMKWEIDEEYLRWRKTHASDGC